MAESHQGLGTLVGEAWRGTLSIVLTFLLSTGLLGGCSYLVLDAPTQWDAINQRMASNQDFSNEIVLAIQLLGSRGQSWTEDKANTERLSTIMTTLEGIKSSSTDNANFISSSLAWCLQSETTLASERGKAKGYVFTDDFLKEIQSSQIKVYDAYLNSLDALVQTFVHWASDSPDARNERIANVKQVNLQVIEALETRNTFFSNSQKTQVNALEQRLGERNTLLVVEQISLVIRTVFALIGILIGVIIILFLGNRVVRSSRTTPAVKQ